MSLPFPIHTIAWQRLVVLLYALDNVEGDPTKQTVIEWIQRQSLLAHRPEDLEHYPSQTEASWITDIAWTRKWGVIFGFVRFDDWNCWEISREGRMALHSLFSAGRDSINLRDCFLWSNYFKRRFDPEYQSSHLDKPPRPKRMRGVQIPDRGIYELLYKELRGANLANLRDIADHWSSTHGGVPVDPNPRSIALAMAMAVSPLGSVDYLE